MADTYYDTSYPPSLWTAADLGSLNPISVIVDTPTPVTITGTGFGPNSRVYVDGVYFPSTVYVSPTQVRFTALGDTVGTQDITVRNGSTESDTLVLGVTATAGVQGTSSPADSPSSPQEAPEAPGATDTAPEAPEASQGTTDAADTG